VSAGAARLFARLEDANFYSGLHRVAANLLPGGQPGQSWLDVGCGPGILVRIAAEKGYAACGIDRDADMIATARSLAAGHGSLASFAVSDIETAAAANVRFDVVSASSLLVVLPKPVEALRQLVNLTKPEGRVLIIEAGSRMSRARAGRLWLRGRLGKRGWMLLLWASVRSGRVLPESTFDQPGLHISRRSLLNGLANAWIAERVR